MCDQVKRGQTYMDRALTITREATDYDQALEALLAAEKLDPQAQGLAGYLKLLRRYMQQDPVVALAKQ